MRVLALLTAFVCGIAGAACSSILGIDNPTPNGGDGGGGDGGDGGDGGGDGGPVDQLMFSIGDFRVAQLQSVRFRATLVLVGGTMQDATATATYSSDDPAVANVATPGQIDGGSQAGIATISASLGAAQPATVKATVTAKQCRPVINEFQTGSAASGSDEWIELLNPCTTAVDVDGWTLVYRAASANGATDTNLMITLTGQLAPGELKLFAGQDFAGANDGKWAGGTGGIMQQNNGGIALRMGPLNTGPIADALAYGTVAAGHPFVEANALPAMVNGRSAQRLPFDGRDDDDGAADFMQVTVSSPRAFNVP